MSITVHIAYPWIEGARFDFDYYVSKHIPMAKEKLGAVGMTSLSASRGIAGRPIDAPPPFFAVSVLSFPDEDTLRGALATADESINDIPKFTDVEPYYSIGSVIE